MKIDSSMFKSRELMEGIIEIPREKTISFVNPKQAQELEFLFNNFLIKNENPFIIYCENKDLETEEYKITFAERIKVEANGRNGFYYASLTLLEYLKNKKVKKQIITDKPYLKVRGLMYDISRNKVPKLSFLKSLVELLSSLRYNHLELYVEGFSFEFKSFEKYLDAHAFLTQEEYRELEKFASSRFIDLVPNVNGFGHMTDWLSLDEFKHLAVNEEGIDLFGTHRLPSTLNPLDEGSVRFVNKLYGDLLPLSHSKFFNMNFDEPFELGTGKSKEACESKGKGNVYIDYLLKLYETVLEYNKKPLIWGDVLLKHPEVLKRIPKDFYFVDWGYDLDYPFGKNLKLLSEHGINFLSAPGTSSWCSVLGRTYNSFQTIYDSVTFTELYGGEGSLLTVWGDMGHLQPWVADLAPIVYFGLLSYTGNQKMYYEVNNYLDEYYKVKNLGATLQNLGRYNELEDHFTYNGTEAFRLLIYTVFALKEKGPLSYFYQKMQGSILSLPKVLTIEKYLDASLSLLEESPFKTELMYGVMLVKELLYIHVLLNNDLSLKLKNKYYIEAKKLNKINQESYTKLFLENFKEGNLNKSLEYFKKLEKMLELLKEDKYGDTK